MSQYNTLKQAIQAVIRTNGNEEITGALLQQSLLSMVNSLGAGYQFMGVAVPTTNPGTPDQKVFYIAYMSGSYPNFNGISIGVNEVAIFKYDSVWKKEILGIVKQDALYSIWGTVNVRPGASVVTNSFFWTTKFGNQIVDGNADFVEFYAHQGTINFYKLKVVNNVIITALITSVVNSASEEGTIKRVELNTKLDEDEYIAINGSFFYENDWGNEYETGWGDRTPSYTSGRILGYAVYSYKYGLRNTVDTIKEKFNDIRIYGLEPSLMGGATVNTAVFFQLEDAQNAKISHVSKIKFMGSAGQTTNIYKVTIGGGQSGTYELLTSVTPDNNGIVNVDVDIDLLGNEYIGISGYVRYDNEAGAGNAYAYLTQSGGWYNITQGGAIGVQIIDEHEYSFTELQAEIDSLKNGIIVDAEGRGDYLSLKDALIGTYGKDTADHPLMITINPGIYDVEPMDGDFSPFCDNRYLSIVGKDKLNTILISRNSYYYPQVQDGSCIKIDGQVYIANLTLMSLDDGYEEPSGTSYHNKHMAYCVHFDSAASENTSLEINNCIMVNDHSCCVGIGIKKKQQVRILNCEMTSNFIPSTISEGYGGATIYAHDQDGDTSNPATEILQVKDCIIKSNSQGVIKLYSNYGSRMEAILINNSCLYDTTGTGLILSGQTDKISKSPLCHGNNVNAMN